MVVKLPRETMQGQVGGLRFLAGGGGARRSPWGEAGRGGAVVRKAEPPGTGPPSSPGPSGRPPWERRQPQPGGRTQPGRQSQEEESFRRQSSSRQQYQQQRGGIRYQYPPFANTNTQPQRVPQQPNQPLPPMDRGSRHVNQGIMNPSKREGAPGNMPPPSIMKTDEKDSSSLPLRDRLTERGIVMRRYFPGQHRVLCPQCGGGSTREKSLAVNISENGQEAVWYCHRAKCEWTGATSSSANAPLDARGGNGASSQLLKGLKNNSGRARTQRSTLSDPSVRRMEAEEDGAEDSALLNATMDDELRKLEVRVREPSLVRYFENRGIQKATLRDSIVRQQRTSNNAKHDGIVAFVYTREKKPVNIKYRDTAEKRFWQSVGGEKVLYGLDDISAGADNYKGTIIIVEGEMDKLSLDQVGMTWSVSVPDGAPRAAKEGELPPKEFDKKFEYVWNCREQLDTATKIVLATDADEPGDALAEEIARRLGRERCWRVKFPKNRKDANDVLMFDGEEALRQVIDSAVPYPIMGLMRFSDFEDEIMGFFNNRAPNTRGCSTGWNDLDRIYRVIPGELTIVTGVPNSGKSEFIDALLVNLVLAQGWTFALCSMENKVRDHARKLLEKWAGAPFFNAAYSTGVERMPTETVKEGIKWLDDHFHLIRSEEQTLPSVEWILDTAKAAVMRYGIRGLVIDPYNELDHQRPDNMNETEYVSQMLSQVKRFAQHHEVHVFFVAHPRQLHGWRGEAPNLYDISGSAHFVNKCDNGLVVHRNREADQGNPDHVKIYMRKVRNKAAGNIGEAMLKYDRITGRYEDL